MPKQKRKYNPRKLHDRAYNFTYEIRVWSGTTDAGKLKECYGFAFSTKDTLPKANAYAFNVSTTIWARLTLGMLLNVPAESSGLLEEILPAESVEVIEAIRASLKAPCYGQLVRLSSLASPQEEIMAQYGTENDGRFEVIESTDCAKAAIERLSA